MSGVAVTESKAFEEDEPNTAIIASKLTRHKSNQLSGGLGPKMTDTLLNHELLMSGLCNTLGKSSQENPLNNQLESISQKTAKTTNHNIEASVHFTMNLDYFQSIETETLHMSEQLPFHLTLPWSHIILTRFSANSEITTIKNVDTKSRSVIMDQLPKSF